MKKTIIALAALALALGGCKKEGCTDSDATNYDSKAKKNCNCCEYRGDLVIWYPKSTADFFVLNLTTSVNVYLDGVLVGNMPVSGSGYFSAAPACGAGGKTFNVDMGSFSSRSYEYRIDDQDGDMVDFGYVSVSANKCSSLKIE